VPDASDPTPDLVVRVRATLWEEFIRDAEKDGLTADDVLERAMSAYVTVRQGQREGALFLLLAPDGTVERLMFGDG
jgi:hypothetical protein